MNAKPKENDRDGHSPKSTVTVATEIHSEKESVITNSTADQAHAVEVMKKHPVAKRYARWHTVTEIAVWCDIHKIDAVAGFAAFIELHGAEYGIGENNA